MRHHAADDGAFGGRRREAGNDQRRIGYRNLQTGHRLRAVMRGDLHGEVVVQRIGIQIVNVGVFGNDIEPAAAVVLHLHWIGGAAGKLLRGAVTPLNRNDVLGNIVRRVGGGRISVHEIGDDATDGHPFRQYRHIQTAERQRGVGHDLHVHQRLAGRRNR